jgi:short-subunit dehydrogenase
MSNHMSVKNKTILITGCSSGIGLCAAKILQQRGYQVFATVRTLVDQARLQQYGLTVLLMDVNNSDSIVTAVQNVLAQTQGRLDALFNNAGFGQPGAIEDISRDTLRRQFETNVFGLQELTNHIVPIMRRQGYGRIINMSSILGLVTMAYRGSYCASKYAVEALSDALRLELQGTGIHVSLLVAGPIKSNFRLAARHAYQHYVNAEQSIHQANYTTMLNNIEQLKSESRLTLTPNAVVKKLIHALEDPHPKPRYYITLPAYFLATLKRILPTRWLDRVMLRIKDNEIN